MVCVFDGYKTMAIQSIGIAFDKVINPRDARIPVRVSELDVPPYLKKLNEKTAPDKLRRVKLNRRDSKCRPARRFCRARGQPDKPTYFPAQLQLQALRASVRR